VDAPLSVNLQWNTAIRGDKFVQLTAREAEILHILVLEMPKLIHSDTILSRLYGLIDEPENSRQCLTVHIYRLRRKLAPIGVDIQCVMTRGYRVVTHAR
jgi:two-component system OmpR family response regulator